MDFSKSYGAYNDRFDMLGFDSSNLISNMGDGFIYILAFVPFSMMTGIMFLVQKKFPRYTLS